MPPSDDVPLASQPPAPPAAALLRAGKLASLDQMAVATASTVRGGAADGCRALDLRVRDGVDLRLLPDRGLDLGAAWFRGTPLAWLSAVGETPPAPGLRDRQWLDVWGGGLITTCGLRNVGVASEGEPMHGRYHSLRARELDVRRELDADEVVLRVAGTVDEVSALGPHLRLRRTVRTRTGAGRVELTDVTTNVGAADEPAPILYHVNLGAPLWDGPATLELDSGEVVPRDAAAERGLAGWSTPYPPEPGADELVFEHRVAADADGWAQARVVNAALGLALTLRWEASGLPRLHQWVHPASGLYALGLEPANCSVLGRAGDRRAGRLPLLAPGATRTTRLQLRVDPLG